MRPEKRILAQVLFGIFTIFSCLLMLEGSAHTPGLIYKPAGSVLVRSVLDPNGDGFTSPSTSGFSGTDHGSGSELNMAPLPSVGGESAEDLLAIAS